MPCPEYYSEFKNWIEGDKTIYTYRKLFRFFKFIQEYKPSKNLINFIDIYTKEKIYENRNYFLDKLHNFMEDLKDKDTMYFNLYNFDIFTQENNISNL